MGKILGRQNKLQVSAKMETILPMEKKNLLVFTTKTAILTLDKLLNLSLILNFFIYVKSV